MIHRAITGSIERFLGILIENTRRRLPALARARAGAGAAGRRPPRRVRRAGARAAARRGPARRRRRPLRVGGAADPRRRAREDPLPARGGRQGGGGGHRLGAAPATAATAARSALDELAERAGRRGPGRVDRCAINWVGVRNFLIIAAIAGPGVRLAGGLRRDRRLARALIIQVLFVAALIVFGYNYFRQNQLAWLVLKPWQRYVIIACGARHRVPADRRLPAARRPGHPARRDRADRGAGAVIVWVVRESRRFR